MSKLTRTWLIVLSVLLPIAGLAGVLLPLGGVPTFGAQAAGQPVQAPAFMVPDDGWMGHGIAARTYYDSSGNGEITQTVTGGGCRVIGDTTSPSIVCGYSGNSASGIGANVAGGGVSPFPNVASADYSTVSGGNRNTVFVTATLSTVGGGRNNNIYSIRSVIAGGYQNTINGEYGTIGGGWNNIITGEVTGGYSVISGGDGNEIYGISGSICGGHDNGITGGGSTPSGAIAGGSDNYIRAGDTVFIGSGEYNESYGNRSAIVGGLSNFITTTGSYATVLGGYYGYASHYGEMVHAAGQFATVGDAQAMEFVARRVVTHSDTTSYTLFLDGASLLMTIPSNGLWNVEAQVVGLTSGAPQRFAYNLQCSIVNDGGTTTLLSTNTDTLSESDAFYEAFCAADDTNDALLIRVGYASGGASYTIRWVATVEVAQVIY